MRRVPAVWLGLLSAAAFGIATPVSKSLLDQTNTFQLAGLLYLGAAIGLSPCIFRRNSFHRVLSMGKANALKISGAVIFGGILGPVFLLIGLKSAQASSVSLWLNLELAATAILGLLLFQDHLSPTAWISVSGVLIAGVLIAIPEGVVGIQSGLWIVGACFFWGLDNHLTALVDGITPVQSTFIKGGIAGAVNFALGLAIHPTLPEARPLFIAISVGMVSYGASIVLYITAAQHLGATRGQVVFATAPFFGLGFSVLILSERLSALQMVAAGILVFSIVLMSRIKHKHSHEHYEMEHVHLHTHNDDHHDHGHDQRRGGSAAHAHKHSHGTVVHEHGHMPDLHHRHDHTESQ